LLAPHPPVLTRVPYTTLFRSVYHRPALPGDQLRYHVRLEGTQDHGATVIGTSHCDGELQAEIELMFAFLEPGRFAEGSLFHPGEDRKSTRLNSSHVKISYAVF